MLRITIPEDLKRVRQEHNDRVTKKMKESEDGDFMLMMKSTRFPRRATAPEHATLEEKIAHLTLLKLRFDLLRSYQEFQSGLMQEYFKDLAPCGLSVSGGVKRLFEVFKGCKTRDQFDERAAAIYDKEGDPELKNEIDPIRQSVLAWWKKLHDLHQSFSHEMPGVVLSVENLPGHGRAAGQMKILMALDRANWVCSMGLKIEDWYVNGKSSMYTWIESILEEAGKWSEEFKC